MATNTSGRIKRSKEIPEDLIATNSKLSPRLPKVIIEEIRIAIGIARVSREALAYQRNLPMVKKSKPFPTRSSMYFHRICIISTKNAIKKVTMKGPKNDFKISLSNFLSIEAVHVTWHTKN